MNVVPLPQDEKAYRPHQIDTFDQTTEQLKKSARPRLNSVNPLKRCLCQLNICLSGKLGNGRQIGSDPRRSGAQFIYGLPAALHMPVFSFHIVRGNRPMSLLHRTQIGVAATFADGETRLHAYQADAFMIPYGTDKNQLCNRMR